MTKLKPCMDKSIEIDEVRLMVKTHFSHNMGYKELCDLTNLSVRELVELIKKNNTTPMMYLRSLKNERP